MPMKYDTSSAEYKEAQEYAEKKWLTAGLYSNLIFIQVLLCEFICKPVVEAILKCKIAKIIYHVAENAFLADDFSKQGIRLDIVFADGSRVVNLEMQNQNTGDLAKRSRIYQAFLDVWFFLKGKLYRTVFDNVVIFFCRFDFGGQGRPRYDYEYICLQDKNLHLNDGTKKIFFNTTKYEEVDEEPLRSFLGLLNGQRIENDFTQKIVDYIDNLKKDPRNKEKFMSMTIGEYFDLRNAEVKQEALIEQVKQESEARGEQNKALEIAKNLIRTLPNLSDSAVADIAELSLKTIRALREKLQ